MKRRAVHPCPYCVLHIYHEQGGQTDDPGLAKVGSVNSASGRLRAARVFPALLIMIMIEASQDDTASVCVTQLLPTLDSYVETYQIHSNTGCCATMPGLCSPYAHNFQRILLRGDTMSSTRAFHTSYIPADVVESVIDELCDDGDSLRACALTARMWVHRSRTHLHRVFVLRHADLKFATKEEAHRYHILTELPSIISYAKELRLQSISSDRKGTEDDVELNTQFHALLRQFRHVRKLSIVGMSFVEHRIKHPRVARLNWETLFPAVHTLSLTNVTFAGPQESLTFASGFRHLQVAELENIALCHDSSDLKMPSPAPSPATYHIAGFQPRTIRLRKCINDVEMLSVVSRHLASQGPSGTCMLESLQVSTGLSLDACNELMSLMTLARRTLVEVHLTIQEQTELPSFQSNMRPQVLQRASQCIDLCESLQVLHLSYRPQLTLSMFAMLTTYKCRSLTIWDIYRELLQGVTRPTFRELVLHVNARDFEEKGIATLEDLLLHGEALRQIRLVFLIVEGYFVSVHSLWQTMSRWSSVFGRIKATHVVKVEYSHKADLYAD